MKGLKGRPQPEEQIDAWQQAWDEVTDELLEGEEVPADTDTAVLVKSTRYKSLLEVTVAQAERLMKDMVAQALTELIDLYSVRYAALQRLQHA